MRYIILTRTMVLTGPMARRLPKGAAEVMQADMAKHDDAEGDPRVCVHLI